MSSQGILDPKQVWKLYQEIGTMKGVADFLLTKKVYNPRTGKAFTRAAIHQALLRTNEYRKDMERRRKEIETMRNLTISL